MALLFIDGFDHYTSDTTKWGSSASMQPSTAVPRTGTQSLRATTAIATAEFISKIFTTSGGAVVGFAFQFTNATPATNDFLQIREGTTVHMAVSITTARLLTVKLGAAIINTGATVLAINSWYYIEFKTIIHDTTGSYELKIDGVTELSVSGIDTRNGGTGVWDRIRLGSVAANTYIDDFYLCDTSGSAPRNDFLGPVKVETLLPQTDAVAAGSNAGLTCSTGTDHGALVDETPPNTSDYNSSPTVGLKDTYEYPAMTISGTIFGVQTNLYISKSDATARQVCAVVRAGGTDYDGANVSPTTTFGYFTEVRQQNPNTGPAEWVVADIATIQAGMKVTL